MAQYISFDRLCGNGVLEDFTEELKQIMSNISNPNTDPEKSRALTIKITFKPDKGRRGIKTSVTMKSDLAPRVANETMMLLGKDPRSGRIEMREIGDNSQVISTLERSEVKTELVHTAPPPRSFNPETGEIIEPEVQTQTGPIDLRAAQ